MRTGTKIGLAILGVGVLGTVSYIGYIRWDTPRLVSRTGNKMSIKFRGKTTVVDVDLIGKETLGLSIGGGYSLSPSYGNESDKSSLNGLSVMKKGNWVKTFYLNERHP